MGEARWGPPPSGERVLDMKTIDIVQWVSTVFYILSGIWIFTFGTLAVVLKSISVSDVISVAGIVIAIIAPEKLIAFFGPALKRKQMGSKDG